MATAAEKLAALIEETTVSLESLTGNYEFTPELVKAADKTHRTKLAASLDKARSVTCVVYVPAGYNGKAFTMREADLRPFTTNPRTSGIVQSHDKEVVTWAFESDDRLVILKTPAQAPAPESVKISF